MKVGDYVKVKAANIHPNQAKILTQMLRFATIKGKVLILNIKGDKVEVAGSREDSLLGSMTIPKSAIQETVQIGPYLIESTSLVEMDLKEQVWLFVAVNNAIDFYKKYTRKDAGATSISNNGETITVEFIGERNNKKYIFTFKIKGTRISVKGGGHSRDFSATAPNKGAVIYEWIRNVIDSIMEGSLIQTRSEIVEMDLKEPAKLFTEVNNIIDYYRKHVRKDASATSITSNGKSVVVDFIGERDNKKYTFAFSIKGSNLSVKGPSQLSKDFSATTSAYSWIRNVIDSIMESSLTEAQENVMFQVVSNRATKIEYFDTEQQLLKKYKQRNKERSVGGHYTRLHPWMQDRPILDGFLGPMNGGVKNGKKVVRYEDKATYNALST